MGGYGVRKLEKIADEERKKKKGGISIRNRGPLK